MFWLLSTAEMRKVRVNGWTFSWNYCKILWRHSETVEWFEELILVLKYSKLFKLHVVSTLVRSLKSGVDYKAYVWRKVDVFSCYSVYIALALVLYWKEEENLKRSPFENQIKLIGNNLRQRSRSSGLHGNRDIGRSFSCSWKFVVKRRTPKWALKKCSNSQNWKL